MQNIQGSVLRGDTMFRIDSLSFFDGEHQQHPEDRAVRNFFAEILRRALDDLRYYKTHSNLEAYAVADAYNDARNAQAWIDGLIESCAIKCCDILTTLQIEKAAVDNYLDTHGIRFNYADRPPRIKPRKTTMKTLLLLICLLPISANAQDIIRFPSAYPQQQIAPFFGLPPQAVIVAPQPRNNFEREINLHYQLQAIDNLQKQNSILEKHLNSYQLPQGIQPEVQKVVPYGFEIIE